MKLFYSPGACSLAVHIALTEASADFQLERVDLKSRTTEGGADFSAINPKGYVPALLTDSREVLTENLAVLDWITTISPSLGLQGPLGRTRMLEVLCYIATELHKRFEPLFLGGGEEELSKAKRAISHRLLLLARHTQSPFMFGLRVTVADCYLFVMLLWAMKFGIVVPDPLLALRASMFDLFAVQKAMEREGISAPIADTPVRQIAGVG